MTRVEQPEFESLELTLFAAGQIPGKARLIMELVRCVKGDANAPFTNRINECALAIIKLATQAVAQQSEYARLVGYKHCRGEKK